jgi:putative adenylate-forming enzyme
LRIFQLLYHYLRTLLETNLLPKNIAQYIVKRRKEKYLKWLVHNSPYYSKYKEIKRLEDLPMGNKSMLMDNFDKINTKGLKKENCFDLALKSENDRNFSSMIGDISVGLSSGTSGNRGLFCANSSERALWAGIILAKVLPRSILSKQKIALFLRANNNLYDRLNSNKIIFCFFDMIIPLKEQINSLESYNPDYLVAPASVLCQIAKCIESKSLKITPTKIFSAAEVLDKADEAYLERVFNQKIHQLYQCTEGFLASTCSHGNLHINEEYIIVEKEYLDKKNGRFIPIITDLFRKTQPIVRYRLNDILVENTDSCPCGSHHLRLNAIEGREDDIFFFKHIESNEEVAVYPDFLRRAVISANDEIDEYRVIQYSAKEIEVQILSNSNISEITNSIRSNFDALFEKLNIQKPTIEFKQYKALDITQKRKRIERVHKGN